MVIYERASGTDLVLVRLREPSAQVRREQRVQRAAYALVGRRGLRVRPVQRGEGLHALLGQLVRSFLGNRTGYCYCKKVVDNRIEILLHEQMEEYLNLIVVVRSLCIRQRA